MVKNSTQYPVPSIQEKPFDWTTERLSDGANNNSVIARPTFEPKQSRWSLVGFAALSLLLMANCTGSQIRSGESVNSIPSEIRQDLTVSGTIKVRGEVKVFSGATLTVKPGTKFLFEPYDPDEDGVNDSRLLVEGVLVARGDPEAPIYFSSGAKDPEPGDWLELRMDHSEGSVLEYCVLEDSRYGLHVHFSSGMVANSVFRNNIDGTRFGNSQFDLIFNRVAGNLGKGINLRASRLVIYQNNIENNRHGIFLFEQGNETFIGLNRFSGNSLSDLRFGDFYEGEPPGMLSNYTPDTSTMKIIGYTGDIATYAEHVDPESVDFSSGPRSWTYRLEKLWKRDLGSFVDASPLLSSNGNLVIFPTWNGGVQILARDTGATVATIEVPDVTDATPVLWPQHPMSWTVEDKTAGQDESVIFPSWDLRIRKADIKTGKVLDTLSWDPSSADDHRQATPLLVWPQKRKKLVLGLWNGQFGMLDPVSMEWVWQVQLDGAVRAKAARGLDGIWVGTDEGSLYRISLGGKILDQIALGAPIRTTPLLVGSLDEVKGGSVVVVTGEGILVRVTEGKIAWRRKLPGPGTYASPTWTSGLYRHFVVGDGSGHLSAYSSDGALMWRMDLGSAVHIITRDDMLAGVAAGTEDGKLYGIESNGRIAVEEQVGGAVHGILVDVGGDDEASFFADIVWGARDGIARAVRLTEESTPWEPPGP